jgi:DNA-binding GntR family transcriptional regulator
MTERATSTELVFDAVDHGTGPRTKRDYIAAELRRMISTGDLTRGSRVRQDYLAEHFRTSITPVREALRLLEAEGLLVGEPHRGLRVAEADIESVKGVYLLRRLIEPYAMQRASRRLSLRDIEEVAASADRSRVNDINREFHFLFYARTGNASLITEIEQLWQQFPWDVLQAAGQRIGESAQEHATMLKATRVGDVETLVRATEEHIMRSYLSIARHLTGRDVPDPFGIDID